MLTADVQKARAKAIARLIGRKQIDLNALAQQPSSSSDAQRILDYLLDLPDAEARRKMLPEAFAAPEGAHQDGAPRDAETEQLSTTPLQLLQVQSICRPGYKCQAAHLLQGSYGLCLKHLTDVR